MSERTPDEITSLEQNILSKSNYMSKNIKLNLNYLKFLSKNAKGEDVKEKVKNVIDLYAARKISQVQTATNTIIKLLSETTGKRKETINKNYEKLVEKHKEVEPLGKRLRQKTETNRSVIKSVEISDKTKAKVEVKINIKEHDMVDDKHRNFDFVYNNLEKRLNIEVTEVMNIKKTMKVQTIIKIIVKRALAVTELGEEPKPTREDSWVKGDSFGRFEEFRYMISSTKINQVGTNNLNYVLQTNREKNKNNFKEEIGNIGSDWRLDRFVYLMVACYEIKPSRGSSYIPTPAPYTNAKCGLINIKNADDKCFSYCMKYHQTDKGKHDDRVTVLNKVDDKYNYDDLEFPVDFDDIKKFEKNNNICINVYGICDDQKIILEYVGDIHNIKNDIIYLLRISDDEKSHYIYIKHIARLLNLNSYRSNKTLCPYCNKGVEAGDFFDNHVKDCYKRACGEGSLIKLPDEGSTMKFKNYKNKIERPYIIYADTESTLEKTDKEKCITSP